MDVLLIMEQPSFTRNSINEDEVLWDNCGQFFAERIWNVGGEKFEDKQEVNLDNVTFNLRYTSVVNNTMRFRQGIETSYFYISNVRSSIREGLTIVNAARRDNMDESYLTLESSSSDLILQEDNYDVKLEQSV